MSVKWPPKTEGFDAVFLCLSIMDCCRLQCRLTYTACERGAETGPPTKTLLRCF
jgi:hypothetical protein